MLKLTFPPPRPCRDSGSACTFLLSVDPAASPAVPLFTSHPPSTPAQVLLCTLFSSPPPPRCAQWRPDDLEPTSYAIRAGLI